MESEFSIQDHYYCQRCLSSGPAWAFYMPLVNVSKNCKVIAEEE